MKAQLVVVQGKPEGKTIPLAMPRFKIGRGEGCQLRPNNDLVSREHAEFEVGVDTVIVRDLGSRNGTQVNGRTLEKGESFVLKNGDLVTVGNLTFAASIQGVPAKATSPVTAPRKPKSLDDVDNEEIDSWLVSDAASNPPERPSGVYGGETVTLAQYNEKEKPKAESPPITAKVPTPPSGVKAPTPPPAAKAPKPAPAVQAPVKPVPEPEPVVDEEETVEDEIPGIDELDDDGIEDLSQSTASLDEADAPEEFIDESNPFYVAKKKVETPAAAASKDSSRDSSDVAGDILRKIMERRRAR